MAKTIYSDADRAKVRVALEVNDGNVKRTARHTGIPIATVRDWKQKWEREGLPAPVAEVLPAIREEFLEAATRVRDKALIRLEEKIDADKVGAKDLIVSMGVLTDKIDRLRGHGKGPDEKGSSQEMMSVEHARELFAGFAKGIVDAARQRDGEIIDAELVEQADEALPPGSIDEEE